MKTSKMKLIRERMKNKAIELNQSESVIAADIADLQAWEVATIQYGQKCQTIKASPRLSQQGISEDIGREKAAMLKQLSGWEVIFDTIAKGLKDVNGNITIQAAKALGVNRAQDPAAMMLEELQKQEIRRQLDRKQEKAEAEHKATIQAMREKGIPISDAQLKQPDVAAEHLFRACLDFHENQEANRLMINSIKGSPVALLAAEQLAAGDRLLKETVCPDLLATRSAAECRAECLDIMRRGLADIIANPMSITETLQFQPAISDQDRQQIAV